MFWVLVAGCLAAAAGCSSDGTTGYTTNSLYRPGIRTVAVPIWQRGEKVYRREVEDRLTEAVQKQIELDTPYKVTSRAKADTELRGTIDEIDQRPMSINPDTGLARELEVTIIVSFTWTDLRPGGKVLVERKNFRVAATYIPEGAYNEDFFQGSEDAINRLAQRIVEQMETPW